MRLVGLRKPWNVSRLQLRMTKMRSHSQTLVVAYLATGLLVTNHFFFVSIGSVNVNKNLEPFDGTPSCDHALLWETKLCVTLVVIPEKGSSSTEYICITDVFMASWHIPPLIDQLLYQIQHILP